MASRSTTVKFQNNTDLPMTLINAKLSHGAWSQNLYPPENIAPNGTGTWESQSDGFMTGTEGTATYMLGNVGDVTVDWENPFAGSNKYSSSAPNGYELSHSGGGGDNANVTFTLRPHTS